MHDNIQEALSCSICSEEFNTTTKQPHLILCFHTFCQTCLQSMIKPSPSSSPSPSPETQQSITCPLCSRVTPCASASSLPVNYALKDLVEASAATTETRCCDVHDEVHPATYWCFECEQGMCNEGHVIHSKTKATKQHQTSKIGTQPQSIRKQVLCSVHGKELDLVCTHDSHAPSRMVCISCVVTSHQSHPCVTAVEYFGGKEADARALLALVKACEVKLVGGLEVVNKEHTSIAANRDAVTTSIDSYFAKIQSDLETRRSELHAQLASTMNSKEGVLQKQNDSLLATLDGVRKASNQLELALEDSHSKAKALVLMEQLQQHLKSFGEVDLQPQELAEMGFSESPFLLPEVHLVDSTAHGTSIASTGGGFPILLSTRVQPSRFEITSTTSNVENEQNWNITNSTKGKYNIQPAVKYFSKQVVAVKLFGKHVEGSPVTIGKWSWSATSTAKTAITRSKIEATDSGAWGMVLEELGMLPCSLTIKIDHKQIYRWAQIALYGSSSVKKLNVGNHWDDSLAFYNTLQNAKNTVSMLQLQREEDGQVTLHHDDNFIWRVKVPACYVYVDIYHATVVAEIVS